MATPAVQCSKLTLGYPGLTTLTDTDLSFPRGQITCIVGGSGCGKSTLLKAAIGLLPPLSGEVLLLGQNLYNLDEADAQRLLTRIGVLFQGGAMLNSITVLENVMIPLREHTDLSEDLMVETALLRLRQVDMEHAAYLLPSELSGGMKKRAALARAMVLDPEVLFCDEPSAGLDPVTAAGLDELILNLKRLQGMTVVVVTHELGSIRAIADNIVMLQPGSLVFTGDLAAADASEHAVVRAFFGRKGEGRRKRPPLLSYVLEGR